MNPFAVGVEGGGWAPGGMRNGEWEEWTEDENVGLELEVLKARREWMQRWRVEEERRREEFDGLGDLEEEGEEEEEEGASLMSLSRCDTECLTSVADLEGPEPPPDLLYDENDLLASALALPRLPSLASDPGNSSQAEDTDMELDDDAEVDPASIHAFEVALAETACPSCRAVKGCIEAKDGGARCGSCGWGIALEVLKPLGEAFGSHHRCEDSALHSSFLVADLRIECSAEATTNDIGPSSRTLRSLARSCSVMVAKRSLLLE